MYLKNIELAGFKSFAKKSDLKFYSPITAIVGPNGSGKSNVAEAFRFVLGEQRMKEMRGKRGEDMIWNGAGSEPRANRASVKLVFDNESKTFNIDFPEVAIERQVHRDGVNEYFINGSKVRLKDVMELLAGARVGTSGHHIISQGEADKVLSASARERKAFVEDALGLRLYQYKRIDSERKLKSTFDNIGQVESLRKEIAPHLRFLKKQVEKVERALSMREELISISLEYFKREDAYLKSGIKILRAEQEPLQGELGRLRGELEEAKAVLAQAALGEKKNYEVLEIERELVAARMRSDSISREVGKNEGLIAAEERIIRKEEELLASNDHKMIPLKSFEELFGSLEGDFHKAQEASEPNIFRAIVSAIKDRLDSFIKESKHSADSERIVDAEQALSGLRKEKEYLENTLQDAGEKTRALEARYEILKREIEKEKDSSHDAEKAVFRIMSEENELTSKLSLLNSQEEKLRLEEAEFRRDLEEVAHLVGREVLRFKDTEFLESPREERTKQEERKRLLEKLKIRLEDAGVTGTEEVLKEYRETVERDQFLERELADLSKSAESLKELIKSLEERLAEEFATGLSNINKEFGALFTAMFGGGEAKLVLTRSKKAKIEAILENPDEAFDEDGEDEIVEEGLDIAVSLPRKKIRGLMMLSGGERALTSIALIFAISQVNPPPFIILDETDAALDEANSKKYGDLVERLAEKSQLILITHNRETMSRAGVIYGVTISSNGASKLLSIAFDEAQAVAK
jgi:chromosome segregation ATPase